MAAWDRICCFVCVCLSANQFFFFHVCLCVSIDAPSKRDPRQGVIHDFITQALHKALSAPLCFFPMLPFFFPVFPTAFFTLCFLCPFSSVLTSSFTHSWIYNTFVFFLVLFGFMSIFQCFFFHSITPMYKNISSHSLLLCSISLHSFFFPISFPSSPSPCKVMQGHKLNLWIETFKTTVSFIYRHGGMKTVTHSGRRELIQHHKTKYNVFSVTSAVFIVEFLIRLTLCLAMLSFAHAREN